MAKKSPQLTLISDTLVQSGLPLFAHLLTNAVQSENGDKICLLALENDRHALLAPELHDLTLRILDLYSEDAQPDLVSPDALWEQIVADQPTFLAIDSVDALTFRWGARAVFLLLKKFVHTGIRLLILHHADSDTAILYNPLEVQLSISSLLTHTGFCSSLVHYRLHPVTLLQHLATLYNVPLSNPRIYDYLHRFQQRGWAGVGLRKNDADAFELETVWNTQAGCVLEWETRGAAVLHDWSAIPSAGKGGADAQKKAVRGFYGLQKSQGQGLAIVLVETLSKSAPVPERRTETNDPQADAITGLPFNLSLTDSQRAAKEDAVLPYLPKLPAGDTTIGTATSTVGGGQIFYEPDLEEDFDEEEDEF